MIINKNPFNTKFRVYFIYPFWCIYISQKTIFLILTPSTMDIT
jgi:hypothetical protein